MTLDRDAARALFDNAEPTPVGANTAPFAVTSPFEPIDSSVGGPMGDPAAYDRMSGRTARKGMDWRLIAPVGVAALCGVAVLVVATQRPDVEPGKTVAASTITRPAPAPLPVAPPIETAAVSPPASSIVEPPATQPTTVVRTRVRTEPARRAAAPRTVAVAPSASDASSNVSAREPYLPPPVLGAPAEVVVVPVAPAPEPVTPPQP